MNFPLGITEEQGNSLRWLFYFLTHKYATILHPPIWHKKRVNMLTLHGTRNTGLRLSHLGLKIVYFRNLSSVSFTETLICPFILWFTKLMNLFKTLLFFAPETRFSAWNNFSVHPEAEMSVSLLNYPHVPHFLCSKVQFWKNLPLF